MPTTCIVLGCIPCVQVHRCFELIFAIVILTRYVNANYLEMYTLFVHIVLLSFCLLFVENREFFSLVNIFMPRLCSLNSDSVFCCVDMSTTICLEETN